MIAAGIDCGAKNTKTVIMRNGKIIGRGSVLTGFDQKKAVEESLAKALEAAGIARNEIEKIGDVIMTSSYESHLKGMEPASLEAKVLRDADWLDAMGARGIARVFVFAGHYGCPEMGTVDWDPESPEKLEMSTSGPDPSPVYHFFSKLLWLKDLMQTDTGRMEAEKRHQFMVNFLKRYREECTP